MRWLTAAIGSMLLACPAAFADCESDAKAAFASIRSGAYHFEKVEWFLGKPVRITGEVIPGVKTRYRYEGQEREEYSERIPGTNGSRDLSLDAFGWKGHGNGLSHWRDEFGYRLWDRSTKEYKCFEEKNENNKRVLVFSLATRDAFHKQQEDRLFVDPESMLPYHREITNESWLGRKDTTDYRYDPAIVIEKPRIHLLGRWNASMRVYDASVKASDPSCRQELLDILDKSSTLPFEFSNKTFLGSSKTGPTLAREDVKGIFVPPDRLLLVETSYESSIPYGAASVSGRVWMANLLTSLRWHHDEKYPGFVYGAATPASWLVWMFPGRVSPGNRRTQIVSNVGYAGCATPVDEEGRQYRAYAYDVYVDTMGIRAFSTHRKMHADPKSGLAVKFESWLDDSLRDAETRQYDASLTVSEPEEGKYLLEAADARVMNWIKGFFQQNSSKK